MAGGQRLERRAQGMDVSMDELTTMIDTLSPSPEEGRGRSRSPRKKQPTWSRSRSPLPTGSPKKISGSAIPTCTDGCKRAL